MCVQTCSLCTCMLSDSHLSRTRGPSVENLNDDLFAAPVAPPAPAPKPKPTPKKPAQAPVSYVDPETAAAPAPALVGDVFDNLDLLSAPQTITHSKELGTGDNVALGRPAPDRAFRVHSDPAWDRVFALFTVSPAEGTRAIKEETYLVAGALAVELEAMHPNLLKWKRFAYWTDDRGCLGLWSVSVSTGGGDNPWVRSALACVGFARTQWVCVQSDMSRRGYKCTTRPRSGEPQWPTWTVSEVLRRAFGDKVITSLSHPVVSSLDGEELQTL